MSHTCVHQVPKGAQFDALKQSELDKVVFRWKAKLHMDKMEHAGTCVLQCVAVCCSVLQCFTVVYCVLQLHMDNMEHAGVLQFVAANCIVLQCCSVWQLHIDNMEHACLLQCVAVCCNVWRCGGVCCICTWTTCRLCCSLLQRVATKLQLVAVFRCVL